MKKAATLAALVVMGVALLGVALAGNTKDVSAAGPCGTTHDAVSAEELQLLGLLKAWRDANISGSSSVPMEQSGALNAAAAWYAQHQVQAGPFGGHQDQFGRNWVGRAQDCGYGSYAAGSGEGVYVVASSASVSVGPNEAMVGLQYPGSGINMPSMAGSSLPAKCYGVGVYREGNEVAWIVIIAQFPAGQPCPGSAASTPSVTATTTTTTTTTTATSTATHTPTSTPTRTPTPTPTPSPSPSPSPAGLRLVLPHVACDSCQLLVPTATATATATGTPTVGPSTPTPAAGSASCTTAGSWRICGEDGTGSGSFAFSVVVEALADVDSPYVTLTITPPGATAGCTDSKFYLGVPLRFDYTFDFVLCTDAAEPGVYGIELAVDFEDVFKGTFRWTG